jgi:hypothetical protein
LAEKKVVEYYNLYSESKLEEDRAQMLRDFYTQVLAAKQAMMPPPMPGQVPGEPMANPEPAPTNPMIPNV